MTARGLLMKAIPKTILLRPLLALGLAALFFGCASAPKIDWASRVGTYTYDQAVLELGPPDKYAELSDGTIVADWISRRSGPSLALGVGTGVGTQGAGAGVGEAVGTVPSEGHLRLTFGKDRKLISWQRGQL